MHGQFLGSEMLPPLDPQFGAGADEGRRSKMELTGILRTERGTRTPCPLDVSQGELWGDVVCGHDETSVTPAASRRTPPVVRDRQVGWFGPNMDGTPVQNNNVAPETPPGATPNRKGFGAERIRKAALMKTMHAPDHNYH